MGFLSVSGRNVTRIITSILSLTQSNSLCAPCIHFLSCWFWYLAPRCLLSKHLVALHYTNQPSSFNFLPYLIHLDEVKHLNMKQALQNTKKPKWYYIHWRWGILHSHECSFRVDQESVWRYPRRCSLIKCPLNSCGAARRKWSWLHSCLMSDMKYSEPQPQYRFNTRDDWNRIETEAMGVAGDKKAVTGEDGVTRMRGADSCLGLCSVCVGQYCTSRCSAIIKF